MVRRKATDQALTVPVLLNEAQRASASGHLRYAKVMWDLAAEDADDTLQQLVFAMKLFMTVPEKTIYQDRVLRFIATFASVVKSQGQLEFIEALLAALVPLSLAKDPAARWRVCQLVHCIMQSLPGEADISDEAADDVQEAMLARLEDAKPNVRAAAARALARLPLPDDDGDFRDCPVTTALLRLLSSDRVKEVRKAVLASLPSAPATHATLLDRTRDESDDVRKMAYLAVAEKVRLEMLGTGAGATLLRRGLSDRAPAVSEAAGTMVAAWLDVACDGEPLALLRWLEPERHPEEAEAALRALIASGRLSAPQIGKLAGEEKLGLRADFSKPSSLDAGQGEDGPEGVASSALMTPEQALFWRVVCECLATEATSKGLAAANAGGANASIEAAAAADRLEALEAALPGSVEEMVGVIAVHAAGGVDCRFATAQLMALAARSMDFTDATGRRAAAGLLHQLLASPQAWEAAAAEEGGVWMEAVGLLARKVHAAPAELSDAMLATLGMMNASHAFAGTGASPAAPAAHLHALRTAALLLEALPTARPAVQSPCAFTLADLVNNVILPGVEHPTDAVRREAVRCLGLYCLLDGIPTPLGAHLPVLRACLASPAQPLRVRTVAAQALGDLALQRGAKALDGLLAVEAAAIVNGSNAASSESAGPIVDLLLNAMRWWEDAFASATGPRKARRGRAGPAAAAEVEDLAALGSAVTEALVRLVAVNEFRQATDERRGEVSALEDGEVLRLLVALLLLHFDVTTQPAARVRQCLAVFFERFAGLSMTSQQYLATAVLPAARTAAAEDIAAGRKTAAAGAVAPQVVRFCLQLLQIPLTGAEGKYEPLGHEPLAELVMGEVLGCACRSGVPKPYLAALCKLPLALPMYDAGEDTRETMVRIQVYATRAAEALTDRAMQKDLAATVERYSAALGMASPELSEEQVTALLAGIKAHVDAFCSGFPMPFGEGEEESSSKAAGGGGRAAVKARGRGGRAAAALASSSSSDEDSSEDEEEGGATAAGRGRTQARRAAPTRAAKPATLAESDSSEDEGNVPQMPPSDSTSEEESSSSDEESENEESAGPNETWQQGEADEERENAVASARKARRSSIASVAALREALKENARIS